VKPETARRGAKPRLLVDAPLDEVQPAPEIIGPQTLMDGGLGI
jgi:hypothetical protein